MNPLVSLKTQVTGEALPALRAGKGLLPSVKFLVNDEVRPSGKATPTLGALIRFLAGMSRLVNDEEQTMGEANPTHGAHIGLLPGVNLLVLCQRPLLRKAFAAVFAEKLFLTRVGHLVFFKVELLVEAPPAFPAHVRLFPGVNPEMDDESAPPDEVLPACWARVRPLLGVRPRVSLKC